MKIMKAPAIMQFFMHVKYRDCITARRTCYIFYNGQYFIQYFIYNNYKREYLYTFIKATVCYYFFIVLLKIPYDCH